MVPESSTSLVCRERASLFTFEHAALLIVVVIGGSGGHDDIEAEVVRITANKLSGDTNRVLREQCKVLVNFGRLT